MSSLNQDLLAIRKKSGLSVDDIYDRTRIPLATINEIEKGTIFTNPQHQLTYIRSYVRSYAKAIQISDDDAIEALDAQYDGSYDGNLAAKYLEEPVKKADVKEKAADSGDAPAISKDDSPHIPAPGPTSTAGINEYSRPDPKRTYNKSTPPPPQIDTVDWADMGQRISNLKSSSIAYVIGLFGLLVLAALVYLLFLRPELTDPDIVLSQSEEQATVSSQEPVPPPVTPPAQGETESAEVTETATTPTAPTSPAPGTQLSPIPQAATGDPSAVPDTIYIALHAAVDKLEPVRITSDINNVRSPYWIEAGDAMLFEFLDRIVIEGQLSRMAIWVNGHHFADFLEYSTGNRTIELTRDIFASYSDFFVTDPDEVPATVEPPRTIHNRPVF